MSLITRILGPHELDYLERIVDGQHGNDGDVRQNLVSELMRGFGLRECGSGTNRVVFQVDPYYVFKVAIDNQGLGDNKKERELTHELEGYVTRTYETNGLIAVAEYVKVFTHQDMVANLPAVTQMLQTISTRYLLDDVGFESYLNFGWRADGTFVILDYAYLTSNEGISFKCPDCFGNLRYNHTFKNLICPDCHTECKVSDMRKDALRVIYERPVLPVRGVNHGFNPHHVAPMNMHPQQFAPADDDNFDAAFSNNI